MSDATTVDLSLQQSCDAAMLHANVEIRLLIDKANRLEAENAKLRELVRDAAILLDETCDTYFEDEYHEIVNRMRELRVEVSE